MPFNQQTEVQATPFQMHQEDGWHFPDLKLFCGISVCLAVTAEHLVVVCQFLFLREQLQAVLWREGF